MDNEEFPDVTDPRDPDLPAPDLPLDTSQLEF